MLPNDFETCISNCRICHSQTDQNSDWLLTLKPVRSHKQIITTRGNVETYLRMIELAFELLFGSEDSMTAINFVNAQLDADESVYPYACKQDKEAFPRIVFK